MTYDYAAIIAKAHAAVAKYGRTIKLVKFDTTRVSGKPWRQDTTPEDTTLEVPALFFPPSQGVKLGFATEINDLAARCSEFALVATSAEIDEYNAVIDGTRRMGIEGMERIKPGDQTVIWIIGVKQ